MRRHGWAWFAVITVCAFDPRKGNTGLDHATVVVAEAAAASDED
jgi:hypothetical protein